MQAGGALPAGPGDVAVQGEDLGVWIAGQTAGWDRLVPVQQYLLETIGVDLESETMAVVPTRRSQGDRWAANLAAARQFHAREGHLQPTRKHVEIVDGEEIRLGSFLDNTRRRAAKLPAERRADLDALGMRW
ncbi:helicase associated domain-containing protein [Streptomyces sp. NBC_00019]|uniref:helicase associated domain-containing protein n=1 Tax=Streptomyces sp. NBC_00019 TaxID=2975623 RepID=UPI00324B95F2